MGTPNGRNAKHCERYKEEDFKDRLLGRLIVIIGFLFFGLFLKVYFFDQLADKYNKPTKYNSDVMIKLQAFSKLINWRITSAISYFPLFILYSYEIIAETCKS